MKDCDFIAPWCTQTKNSPTVCANPIMVICSVMPTVTDPNTKMEIEHTVGHKGIDSFQNLVRAGI